MNPKISILVCRLPQRYKMWELLKGELQLQCMPYPEVVEILSDNRSSASTGEKRNRLLEEAKGSYVCFLDDDDWVSRDYIKLLIDAADSGKDAASLKGVYSVDGTHEGIFEHSIKYKEWRTTDNEIKYERFHNHLNLISARIAKRIKFPEKNFGEDFEWSTGLHKLGLIKTEHYIPEVIYHYNYVSNKKENMSYSQSSEDLFIMDYFADTPDGKFLDIGAYDVFRFSNVRGLYEKGWGGVLVEPTPSNYKAIAEHYAHDEKITVLNIAIGETTGEIDFYESDGDAVSTSELYHMKKWEKAGVKFSKIKVPQLSVEEFMNLYANDADFLNIDTEATNITIFRNIPTFVFEQVKMICIEHDQHQNEIEETLTPYGFNTLHINGENIILAK